MSYINGYAGGIAHVDLANQALMKATRAAQTASMLAAHEADQASLNAYLNRQNSYALMLNAYPSRECSKTNHDGVTYDQWKAIVEARCDMSRCMGLPLPDAEVARWESEAIEWQMILESA